LNYYIIKVEDIRGGQEITFSEVEKELEKALGAKKASLTIYNGIKEGSIEYNKQIAKFFKMRGIELTKWQCNSVTLSGWGIVNVIKYDEKQKEAIITVKDSTFAKSYGPSTHPVDNIIAGFAAAKMVAEYNDKKIDCVETKCIGKGNEICEFVIGHTKMIEKLREKVWNKR
jgi:predicted hydrocarbon binding protein